MGVNLALIAPTCHCLVTVLQTFQGGESSDSSRREEPEEARQKMSRRVQASKVTKITISFIVVHKSVIAVFYLNLVSPAERCHQQKGVPPKNIREAMYYANLCLLQSQRQKKQSEEFCLCWLF